MRILCKEATYCRVIISSPEVVILSFPVQIFSAIAKTALYDAGVPHAKCVIPLLTAKYVLKFAWVGFPLYRPLILLFQCRISGIIDRPV